MYEKQQWIDNETPLSAQRLNHMEEGIEANARVDYVATPADGGTTSGNGVAYVCTTTPAPLALEDKLGIVITSHTTSGDNPTLNWNGLGAKPIIKANGNPAKLSAKGIYTLRYSIIQQSFILQGEGAEVDASLFDGKPASQYQSQIKLVTITIPNTDWIDNDGEYMLKKNVASDYVVSESWVDLSIDVDFQYIAIDAGVSPFLNEYNGGFTIYANSIPSGELVGKVKVINSGKS